MSRTPQVGQRTDLTGCDIELIRVPGAIQPHGILLVVRSEDLVVVAASANWSDLFVDAVFGRTLTEVLGQPLGTEVDALRFASRPRRIALLSGREVDVFVRPRGDGTSLLELEYVTSGRPATLDTFQDDITAAMSEMREARGVEQLLPVLCRLVRRVSGFDRVMAYRFASDGHGVVVAEERRVDLEPFLGLHYPASDIPLQARELYLEHWLRFIPDARYEPVPIQADAADPTAHSVDMSECVLRAVSPVHLEYLANMGVRASMSVSLVVDGRLWGLVACHHYAGTRRIGHRERAVCEFIGLAAGTQIGMLEALHASMRRTERSLLTGMLLKSMASSDAMLDGLVAESEALLLLAAAEGAVIVLGGRTVTIGTTPSPATVERLRVALLTADPTVPFVSDRWGEDASDLRDAAVAAGVLAVPMSRGQGNFVAWFRPEMVHTVTWAGRPEKVFPPGEGLGALRPRLSFEAWADTVRGRSVPWLAEDVDAVAELRSSIGTFLLAQAEQLTRLNAELTRSNEELDAFAYAAAHDLKEPLRGIHNYANFLVEDYEDLLDASGREKLATLMRLARRMAILLDSLLDYSRVTRVSLRPERVAVREIVTEVVEMLGVAIGEANATVSCTSEVFVVVDRAAFREVLMNLISNAIKYTNRRPLVTVSCAPAELIESHHGADLGERTPVVSVIDNGIGIDANLLGEVFKVFRRLHDRDAYGGGTGAGLTIAKRIVERHGGSIWATSIVGKGSTFSFSLGDPQ